MLRISDGLSGWVWLLMEYYFMFLSEKLGDDRKCRFSI